MEQDEFTEHKELKTILAKFVMAAYDAQSHYLTRVKQMVKEVALSLEEKLIEMGKPELICHISGELVSILKQHKIGWHREYIRRCLEEKYKDPAYRAAALTRHERNKKENAGVPSDSGRTLEELEAALQAEQEKNKKAVVGEYVVSSTYSFALAWDNRKEFEKALSGKVKDAYEYLKVGDKSTYDGHFALEINTPVMIKVNVKERNATVEMDLNRTQKLNESNAELDKQRKGEEQNELSKSKSKPKSKSNPDTKSIPKTKPPSSPREEKARQIIESLEGNLKSAKTGEEANQIVENFHKELRDFTEAKPEAKDPDQ